MRNRKIRAAVVATILFSALQMTGACAQDSASKGNSARPEVGKPVQAAIDLIRGKKGKEAMARLREAQAVRDRTPYENYLIERVLGQVAIMNGDPATAARALEAAAASPAGPEAEKRQLLAAAAGQYYQAKDYRKAAEIAERHFAAGGTDRSLRAILIQSLYLSNNFSAAIKLLSADIDAEERGGQVPSENQLQLLANAYLQQKDNTGYTRAMERLVSHYPKRDYWLVLLQAIPTRPGYSDKLALDVARLKIATETMGTTEEYVEAAQLALQDGFPKEALKIIEVGYAAGRLGTGAEATRHQRLKDMAAKNHAEDLKASAKDESQPAGREGKVLFNEGFNNVLNGKTEKGLAMMEQGIRMGSGFTRPEQAKLQLGYAYHLAGQDSKAVQVYRTAQGTDGTSTIAKLWITRLSRR